MAIETTVNELGLDVFVGEDIDFEDFFDRICGKFDNFVMLQSSDGHRICVNLNHAHMVDYNPSERMVRIFTSKYMIEVYETTENKEGREDRKIWYNIYKV